MEKNFTEQDSLMLINEMITQARDNIQKGAADSMVFSGYCVAFTAVLNFVLLQILNPSYLAFWVWLLMIPMSIGCFILNKRTDKKAIVKTHVDKIVSNIWFAFFISVICLLTVVFGFALSTGLWVLTILITPFIMIMMGAAQYVTSVTSRYKPFRTGAYVFWLGGVLCMVYPSFTNLQLQFIILAVCMIFGFVVPGHILNRKAKEHV